MQIRDRIRELRRVPSSQLKPNPKNWRTHPIEQQDALRGLLAEVGFAGAVLARELADGSLQLIDGHLRTTTAEGSDIPVLILDVTEEEADKILATYDPIGAMSGRDQVMLDELLRGIETDSPAIEDLLCSIKQEEDDPKIPQLPEDFTTVDESIHTEYQCPKCKYCWSGQPK